MTILIAVYALFFFSVLISGTATVLKLLRRISTGALSILSSKIAILLCIVHSFYNRKNKKNCLEMDESLKNRKEKIKFVKHFNNKGLFLPKDIITKKRGKDLVW